MTQRSSSLPLPRIWTPVLLMAAGLCLPACSAPPPRPQPTSYQTVTKDPHHDADLARRENARAVALLEKADNPAALASAEAALKAALEADVTCGPAHNNLGKVYYRQGKLYLAAWEFQYATKLLPNQPEPPNNLGLVYEAAGKLDEAADAYAKAVDLDPENLQALGNLARAKVRRGDHDAGVRALLAKLVRRDTRPDWLAWENQSLARMPQTQPPGANGVDRERASATRPD
jgi:Flp pilus assembly protein TadD